MQDIRARRTAFAHTGADISARACFLIIPLTLVKMHESRNPLCHPAAGIVENVLILPDLGEGLFPVPPLPPYLA
ncbi:hypothetical protein, partial [Pararhodobacter sp.]|uniref:hypothetical protein n=1 Tax=Pararhodobacter sp. TaxID=2127056 RepID=UPI002FDD5701